MTGAWHEFKVRTRLIGLCHGAGMEEAALAISICAFVLSAFGAAWTTYEWNRSGARLKVEVTSFVAFGGMSMMGGPMKDQWMIALDVSHSGRTATTVHSIGFERPTGGVIVMSEPAMGPNPLPKRLEPGESLTYPVDAGELLTQCRKNDLDYRRLVPYVSTGHGQFKGKWKKVALDVMQARTTTIPPLPGKDRDGA